MNNWITLASFVALYCYVCDVCCFMMMYSSIEDYVFVLWIKYMWFDGDKQLNTCGVLNDEELKLNNNENPNW